MAHSEKEASPAVDEEAVGGAVNEDIPRRATINEEANEVQGGGDDGSSSSTDEGDDDNDDEDEEGEDETGPDPLDSPTTAEKKQRRRTKIKKKKKQNQYEREKGKRGNDNRDGFKRGSMVKQKRNDNMLTVESDRVNLQWRKDREKAERDRLSRKDTGQSKKSYSVIEKTQKEEYRGFSFQLSQISNNKLFQSVAWLTSHDKKGLLGVGVFVYAAAEPDIIYLLTTSENIANPAAAAKMKAIVKLDGGPDATDTTGRNNFEYVLVPFEKPGGFIQDRVSNITLCHVKGGGLNSDTMDHHVPASHFATVMEPYLYNEDLPQDKLMCEFLMMIDIDFNECNAGGYGAGSNFAAGEGVDRCHSSIIGRHTSGIKVHARSSGGFLPDHEAYLQPSPIPSDDGSVSEGKKDGNKSEDSKDADRNNKSVVNEDRLTGGLSTTADSKAGNSTAADGGEGNDKKSDSEIPGSENPSGSHEVDEFSMGLKKLVQPSTAATSSSKTSSDRPPVILPFTAPVVIGPDGLPIIGQETAKPALVPDEACLEILPGDEILSQTSASLRYPHRSENEIERNGQPLFYLKKDESTGSFMPILAAIHLSNNQDCRRDLERVHREINRALEAEFADDKESESDDLESDSAQLKDFLMMDKGRRRRERVPKRFSEEELREKEKHRKQAAKEELSKFSPFGVKIDAVLRLLCERRTKIRIYYEDLFLHGVLGCDYRDARVAAACVGTNSVNRRIETFNNRTLLHLIGASCSPGHSDQKVSTQITQLLLRSQADITITDNKGWTPLMYHAVNSTLETLTLMTIKMHLECSTEELDTVMEYESRAGWNLYELAKLHHCTDEVLVYIGRMWPRLVRPGKIARLHAIARKFGK